MLFGINGYIGSGKDTVGMISQELTAGRFQIKKFAAKLKEIASLLTGIPTHKFEDQEFKKTYLPSEWDDGFVEGDSMTVRTFLQKLGTEAIRNGLHTNAWVNALFADYKELTITTTSDQGIKNRGIGQYPDWIITDTRFPNEAQAIKQRGGVVIRINRRPGNDWDLVEHCLVEKHPSETSLDTWKFDYVINNNGTLEELAQKVRIMLNYFNILNDASTKNTETVLHDDRDLQGKEGSSA